MLASSSDKYFWLTQVMPLTNICAKLFLSSVEYAFPICIMIAILNKDIHDKKTSLRILSADCGLAVYLKSTRMYALFR